MLQKTVPGHVIRLEPGDARPEPTPAGIQLAAGSVALVVASVVAALAPHGLRLAVVGAALFGVAALSGRVLVAAYLAVAQFLVFDGFLEDHTGDLSWHRADPGHLAALAAALGAGWIAGALWRRTR